ncbi:hypothetical protein [Enterobacillus tribolii]|uniref:Uncharacterized protein n=1 Tax=Enterobacillus tribolii TaxID=1487935 RepID=A0A370QGJ2_9GAMM|nr:hypothetical protein [Enterobacillus tribolii]MBW7981803.1 hypothetical protein [Enterobacillus tribolii]RDK87484.1 hypothetical protein C8D90_10979 [Enterobacillus tribolii]
MITKSKGLRFFIIVGILSGFAIFIIAVMTFLISHGVTNLFMEREFMFPFDYVTKALIMGVVAGFLVGGGMWIQEYKKRN